MEMEGQTFNHGSREVFGQLERSYTAWTIWTFSTLLSKKTITFLASLHWLKVFKIS